MSISNVRPSRWYYGFGILIIALAGAYSLSTAFSTFSEMQNQLQQFLVPGSTELSQAESGEYVIFYESESEFQGNVYLTGESKPGLQIEVKNKTTGSRVATYILPGRTSFSMGGRSGVSLLAFNIDSTGVYEISARYPNGAREPQVVLSVGHGFVEGILSQMWKLAIIYLGSMVLGIAVIVLTYMKRQKAQKLQKEASSDQ
jgi:hypothetical protein